MRYCCYCMSLLNESDKTCSHCGHADDYICPADHLQPGTTLQKGKYVVGAAIGSGGFGVTYIALDTVLNLQVAIKEFYPKGFVDRAKADPALVTVTGDNKAFFKNGKDRFLWEARILAGLSDETGIVNVRDFFEENNTAYIVMEYLRGQTLKSYLKKAGRIPYRQAFSFLYPIMTSLKAVHAKGLIHRDISPDNIMLTNRGVKLLDFGAARDVFSHDSVTVTVLMKPGYTPEEQYSNNKQRQGTWCDVYALCATLYKCITGKTPIDAIARRSEELSKPSEMGIDIDPAFEQVLMKGLEIHYENRYQDMDSLIDAFESDPNQETIREDNLISSYDYDEHAARMDVQTNTSLETEATQSSNGISLMDDETVMMDEDFEQNPDQNNTASSKHEGHTFYEIWDSDEEKTTESVTNLEKPEETQPTGKRILVSEPPPADKKIGVIAGGIVLLVLIIGIVVYLIIPKTVEIPDLEGKTEEEVLMILDEEDIQYYIEYEESKTTSKDYLISQSISAGSIVPKKTVLEIVISSGKLFTLPDFSGETLEEAARILQENGIDYDADETEYSDTIEIGCVISQSPAPGTDVSESEEVVLVISEGVEQISVPYLSGMTEEEAKELLDEQQLQYSITREYNDYAPKGEVIDQTPSENSFVDKYSVIEIVISLGAKPTTEAATKSTRGYEKPSTSSSNSTATTESTTADPFGGGWIVGN